jgi:serine/threonine-protein kinase RsbW
MIVKIPSIRENVSIVESFIENAGDKVKIKESVYGNVLVSVTEAVNNAIVHGNKEDKNKKSQNTTSKKQEKCTFCY